MSNITHSTFLKSFFMNPIFIMFVLWTVMFAAIWHAIGLEQHFKPGPTSTFSIEKNTSPARASNIQNAAMDD